MVEQHTSRAKILVIDDSELVLEITTEMLENHGFQVVVHRGAFGASAAVLREKPDLVLLDINMTGISGDDLIAIIRRNEKNKDLKMVLYSDRPEEELKEALKKSSANGYIQKVMDEDLLALQVSKWTKA